MLQLNVVASSMKILIDIGGWGYPHDWEQHWENVKNPLLDSLKIYFQRFFTVSSLQLISSEDSQSIDFIKPNVNWTHKVKYINQINGGLIMFSHNKKLKNIFFKLDQLWTIFTESLQKKEHNQNSSVFKALR